MNHTVRVMRYPEESDSIGRLRYEVFVSQLHWVTGDSSSGLELDDLDPIAHHIGVFNSNDQLVGYTRIIQGGGVKGLLLEQPVFKPLFVPVIRLDATTAEVSRLCAKPGNTNGPEILGCLVRAIYGFAVALHAVTLYATTDDTNAGYINKEFLEKQLLFNAIAGPHQFAKGVNTYLLALDMSVARKAPLMQKLLNP